MEKLAKVHRGNSKSLWNTVKKSIDINFNNLLDTLTLNGSKISDIDLPDAFAEFFSNKVNTIGNNCVMNDNVYNCRRKLNSNPENSMTPENVLTAIKSLKAKKKL